MKLLAVAGDISSLIAGIRLVTPLQAVVQAQGGSLVLRSLHDCTQADLAAAEVLVMQRGMSARAWRLQLAMRLRGGAVVAEIDDLLTDLPAHISNHAAVHAQRRWIERCLTTADVVSVSTARLGQELRADLGIWRARIALAARAAVRERHTPAHTVAAWQVALDEAMQGRVRAVLAPPTWRWRWLAAASAAWEPAALRLRALNRARLARRQQARRSG